MIPSSTFSLLAFGFWFNHRLPIEDASGEEIFAEGTSTKKKDAVVACAYEACRIIDAHGMLRNAMHGIDSLYSMSISSFYSQWLQYL